MLVSFALFPLPPFPLEMQCIPFQCGKCFVATYVDIRLVNAGRGTVRR